MSLARACLSIPKLPMFLPAPRYYSEHPNEYLECTFKHEPSGIPGGWLPHTIHISTSDSGSFRVASRYLLVLDGQVVGLPPF